MISDAGKYQPGQAVLIHVETPLLPMMWWSATVVYCNPQEKTVAGRLGDGCVAEVRYVDSVLDTPKNREKRGVPLKVKPVVIRPRCSGTMTEAMFWNMVRRALRTLSTRWLPKQQAKLNARRKYTAGINKRQTWEYQCCKCLGWFMEKETEVHHKEECGSLNCANDLPGFVERLLCESDKFGVVCIPCHDAEHKASE